MVPCLITLLTGLLFLVSAQTNNINNDSQRSELEDPSQPQTIQLNSDHAFYDSSRFSDNEIVASAVSPFCKSFAFLCHIRCLQRGDCKNPGNVNEFLSPEQQARSQYKGSEINRCSHIPNTNKIQVLCCCNNGVDLTAELCFALEGGDEVKPANEVGSGIGEAGMIHQMAYPETTTTVTIYKTLTKVRTTTVTVTLPSASNAATPVGKSVNKGESGPAFFALGEDIQKKGQRDSVKDDANSNDDGDADVLETGNKSDLDEEDWSNDPNSYKDPSLEQEYGGMVDEQERACNEVVEVEREGDEAAIGGDDDGDSHRDKDRSEEVHEMRGSIGASERDVKEVKSSSNNRSPTSISLRKMHSDADDDGDDDDDGNGDDDEDNDGDDDGHDDDDDNDRDTNNSDSDALPRNLGHRVDHEPMYPPFDVEAEPSYKHSNHKHSHGDNEKEHRVKDRDQHE
ncbi:hypothetical protein BGZ58_006813 [Dissophora ornata]|nr:hypothetical protein BGZ58_006813 [Dissophora ornata]